MLFLLENTLRLAVPSKKDTHGRTEPATDPASFLFRRKKWSACAGSAGPQTDGRWHILRCRRSEYHSGYASLLRLVFARVRRACASAFPCKPTTQKKIICGTVTSLRSCRFPQRAAQNGRFVCEPSSFLFRRKEAKENQVRESCFSAHLRVSPTRCTKRTVHIRTVRFPFRAGRAGKHLFTNKSTAPQCLLFLFFKKRNRSPVEEKKTFSCRT